MVIENADPTSVRGHLVVAAPSLHDPNFDRAVIFMLEHGDDGALGVIVNRPSELPVAGTIDDWARFAAVPSNLFIGGPVSPSSVIALAAADGDQSTEGWTPILDSLGTVDLAAGPESVPSLRAVRMFAGYAGWSAGQLEAELISDSWFVVDAEVDDLLDPEPRSLWWRVLGRQGGALGRLVNYPDDPWVN